jgi:hypothetical protein
MEENSVSIFLHREQAIRWISTALQAGRIPTEGRLIWAVARAQ